MGPTFSEAFERATSGAWAPGLRRLAGSLGFSQERQEPGRGPGFVVAFSRIGTLGREALDRLLYRFRARAAGTPVSTIGEPQLRA